MPSSEAVPLGLGACRRSGALAGMLALVARLLEWLRSLFWKEEMELTLVGLQYSGKTTLLTVLAVRGRGPAGAGGGLGGGWKAAAPRGRGWLRGGGGERGLAACPGLGRSFLPPATSWGALPEPPIVAWGALEPGWWVGAGRSPVGLW